MPILRIQDMIFNKHSILKIADSTTCASNIHTHFAILESQQAVKIYPPPNEEDTHARYIYYY